MSRSKASLCVEGRIWNENENKEKGMNFVHTNDKEKGKKSAVPVNSARAVAEWTPVLCTSLLFICSMHAGGISGAYFTKPTSCAACKS